MTLNDADVAAGYAIYREFIRYGVGSCMEIKVNGRLVPETPEQACLRRWQRLPDRTREQFIAEGRAAIQAIEDMR